MKKCYMIFIILNLPYSVTCNIGDPRYCSQFMQDKYVNENIFKERRGGVFVDVGAYDGVADSNTYFFEKYLGWTGVCVEANPDIYNNLVAQRSCRCINVAASNIIGTIDFCRFAGLDSMLSGFLASFPASRMKYMESLPSDKFSIIKVPTMTLTDICRDANITHIDFLSVDVEGHEYEVLSSMNFDKIRVDVVCFEFICSKDVSRIQDLLTKNKFSRFCVACIDEIWVRNAV